MTMTTTPDPERLTDETIREWREQASLVREPTDLLILACTETLERGKDAAEANGLVEAATGLYEQALRDQHAAEAEVKRLTEERDTYESDVLDYERQIDNANIAKHAAETERDAALAQVTALREALEATGQPLERQQLLAQHQYAKAWNDAIEKARSHLSRNRKKGAADLLGQMELPYWPEHVEEWFQRRNELLDRKGSLSTDEEGELEVIRSQIDALPFARTLIDDEATGLIRRAAALIKNRDAEALAAALAVAPATPPDAGGAK
jgi:hypothetical protein